MEALLFAEDMSGEVIKDQQLHFHQSVHEPWIAAIQLCHGEILEETRRADIENRMVMSCGLTAQSTGQP